MAGMDETALLKRWRALRQEVTAAGAGLLAVSKYASDDAVAALLDAGQRDFGESRPQRLRDRARAFPAARWHMIGPLQRNKAKYVARHAAMWHSVEDEQTAREVAGYVSGRRLPVLVQVNVSGEARKHGVAPEQAARLVEAVRAIPELELRGLMGMAPKEGDVRSAFRLLRRLRDALAPASLPRPDGKAAGWMLCMGMSNDWRIAIEEGADMVRLGSALFGPANTPADRGPER